MTKTSKPEHFALRVVKGYGYYLMSQIMSLFVYLSLMALAGWIVLRIICALCVMGITLGLMFNWAYNACKNDLGLHRSGTKPLDTKMGYKMAGAIAVLPIVMLVVLILGKVGVLGETFPIFILLDPWISPFVSLFTESRTAASLGVIGLLGILLLILTIPAAVIITYECVRRDVNISGLIYKKADNE
ncbi:MAG: hypothetical protein LBM87_07995 [Ruminococcus sp.]|jgi:hypothetical protein|nr:hypothetical protein [Ruminococcus sp.]